jgi:hypothetical protein
VGSPSSIRALREGASHYRSTARPHSAAAPTRGCEMTRRSTFPVDGDYQGRAAQSQPAPQSAHGVLATGAEPHLACRGSGALAGPRGPIQSRSGRRGACRGQDRRLDLAGAFWGAFLRSATDEPEIAPGRRAGAMERADLDPEMSPPSAPQLGDAALRAQQIHEWSLPGSVSDDAFRTGSGPSRRRSGTWKFDPKRP